MILAVRGLALLRCPPVLAAPVPRLRLASLGLALLVLTGGPACTKDDAPPAENAPASVTPSRAETPPDEAPPAPALPAAEELLDRAAVAMGGKEAFARVHSFHYRGTLDMQGQNIRGDLEIWWKDGNFYMEQAVPGIGKIKAGKQGEQMWAEDPVNGRRTLTGVEAEQHAWASSLLLAAEWQRYFDRAQTVAVREVDGRTLYDVRLQAASGLEVTMSFDAESGLQVGQSFEQVTPMGKQPFEVTFEDYRDVEGIKLAHRQVIDAKIQTVVQEITEVELNAEVDESRFALPRDDLDVVRQPELEAG